MKYFVNRRHASRRNLSKSATSRLHSTKSLDPINITVKMKLALFALFAGSAAAFAPAQTGVRSFWLCVWIWVESGDDGLKSVWLMSRSFSRRYQASMMQSCERDVTIRKIIMEMINAGFSGLGSRMNTVSCKRPYLIFLCISFNLIDSCSKFHSAPAPP